jgi:hypothetical protein
MPQSQFAVCQEIFEPKKVLAGSDKSNKFTVGPVENIWGDGFSAAFDIVKETARAVSVVEEKFARTPDEKRLGNIVAIGLEKDKALEEHPVKIAVRNFSNKQDDGWDEGMDAAFDGAEAIEAYAAKGGIFTGHMSKDGWTGGILAAANGPDTIEAYGEAGGIFTGQKNSVGMTARGIAAYYGEKGDDAFNSALAAQQWAESVLPWRHRERFGPSSLLKPNSRRGFSKGGLATPGL